MLTSLLVNNAMLIVQYAVSGLVPLVLIPHIVRTLGLGSYGDIAIGFAWANYAAIIVQYAFQLTGPRYLAHAEKPESDGTIFWGILLAKLLLFALSGAVATIIWYSISTSSLSTQVFLAYALLPLGAVFHTGWFLQAQGRFFSVALISAFATIISLVIGLVFVRDAGHTQLAVCSLVLGAFLSGVGTFLVSVTDVGSRPLSESVGSVSVYLRDGWTVFLSQFIASAYMLSGPIIIGWLQGASLAGAYSAVERVVTTVSSVCILTHTAAYPRLAVLYSTNRVEYARLLKIVLIIYVSLALLFCSAIVFAGPVLAKYVFGADWQSYLSLLWWGSVLIMLAVVGPLLTGYYVVSGQQEKVYPLTLKVLFISFLLGVPGVKFFGVWAWFCSMVFAQSLVLVTGIRVLGKRERCASTAP